jgi:hypothetical protein
MNRYRITLIDQSSFEGNFRSIAAAMLSHPAAFSAEVIR